MGIVGSRTHPEVVAAARQRDLLGGPPGTERPTVDDSTPRTSQIEDDQHWTLRLSHAFDDFFVFGNETAKPKPRKRRRDAFRPLLALFQPGQTSDRYVYNLSYYPPPLTNFDPSVLVRDWTESGLSLS